jgi:hypothetical protein
MMAADRQAAAAQSSTRAIRDSGKATAKTFADICGQDVFSCLPEQARKQAQAVSNTMGVMVKQVSQQLGRSKIDIMPEYELGGGGGGEGGAGVADRARATGTSIVDGLTAGIVDAEAGLINVMGGILDQVMVMAGRISQSISSDMIAPMLSYTGGDTVAPPMNPSQMISGNSSSTTSNVTNNLNVNTAKSMQTVGAEFTTMQTLSGLA